MRSREMQRGEGRVGLIIALFVVGLTIFLGVKVIPVRVSAYEFRDVLREEARYGAVRNDDASVAKRIISKAHELEIPLKASNLSVRRTTGEMIISAEYEQAIDLKFTTYVYRFTAQERAPLF